jgi:hypothetical protein
MNDQDNLDRRREPRTPHSGVIEISFEDPGPMTITADLIEVSAQGFRAAHDAKSLAPGLVVRYGNESSRARVMWTHVLEGRCVSGFLVLPV